ncbi:unnamed protein product [Thelazia callipaeda]|uniref:Coiled-coil domain-containing protein 194 n=1 Tax=Thelazia callipaeda TaxID=103827 RepID=A0A0N5D7F0_THECL|nr:unnamed protein product [Thelazia callipaeda]
MCQKVGLLLDSDDSDVPDLDLPTVNVRKERSVLARPNAETAFTHWYCCNMQHMLILLLFTIVIAIAFLGFFTVYILSQIHQLRSDGSHDVLMRELAIVKHEMRRIKMHIDASRLVTSSSGTSFWNTSSLLNNTRLEQIEAKIDNITKKTQERLNVIKDACMQGCEAVSKFARTGNETEHLFTDSVYDKSKKKRSKSSQRSFSRDIPVVFTRGKHSHG